MSINKYVPRSLQNIKDRLEAFNESITKKLFSTDLPNTFEVMIYTQQFQNTRTPPTPPDEDTESSTSKYFYYKARSLAGHHDHLNKPEEATDVDTYERFRNAHFQAIIKKSDENNLPKLGDVYTATFLGANLVSLDSFKRTSLVLLKIESQNPAQDAHTNPVEPVRTSADYATSEVELDGSEATELDPYGESPAYGESPVGDYGENPLVPPADATQRKLLDFISKGEGGYEASNNGTKMEGTAGPWFVNSIGRPGEKSWVAEGLVTKTKERSDQKLLSTLTLGEIKRLQGWNTNFADSLKNPTFAPKWDDATRSLFAVGAYQIIPATFSIAQTAAGLSDSDIFNKENQDKMGLALIYVKQADLGAYLKGPDEVTAYDAQLAFAKEWASIPDPKKYRDGYVDKKGISHPPGESVSYYGSGNKAHHTMEEVEKVLKEVRALNIKNGFTV